uniref:Cytochrome P450 2J2-like n=1 Tax=Saccoglossus kowalevskii TaxID=10224 RepID=A0ABM0LX24_SACKO
LATRSFDHVWKKHRTFMVTQFRNFGVGKGLDIKIQEEAESLCQALEASNSEPVDCHLFLQHAVTNVLNEFFKKQIQAREDVIYLNNPRDFTEALLREHFRKQELKQQSILDDLENDMETITHLISELFRAATETTHTTLRWTMMFIATHPEIQEKIYQEIEDVVAEQPSMIATVFHSSKQLYEKP